jgi:hypothetical protein
MKAAPKAIATKPARRAATESRRPSVSDAHRGGERDAERNHEKNGRDLQRDLMSGERGRANQTHQERRR